MTANKIKVSCLDCLSTHEVENKNNQELCIYCKCGAKLQIRKKKPFVSLKIYVVNSEIRIHVIDLQIKEKLIVNFMKF